MYRRPSRRVGSEEEQVEEDVLASVEFLRRRRSRRRHTRPRTPHRHHWRRVTKRPVRPVLAVAQWRAEELGIATKVGEAPASLRNTNYPWFWVPDSQIDHPPDCLLRNSYGVAVLPPISPSGEGDPGPNTWATNGQQMGDKWATNGRYHDPHGTLMV